MRSAGEMARLLREALAEMEIEARVQAELSEGSGKPMLAARLSSTSGGLLAGYLLSDQDTLPSSRERREAVRERLAWALDHAGLGGSVVSTHEDGGEGSGLVLRVSLRQAEALLRKLEDTGPLPDLLRRSAAHLEEVLRKRF